MPQSSSEMYELMRFICGSETGVEDGPPMNFLLGRGYKLITPQWEWLPPSPDHFITPKEVLCVQFLIEEWDYGGFHPIPEKDLR
jgi:hypothetical protein